MIVAPCPSGPIGWRPGVKRSETAHGSESSEFAKGNLDLGDRDEEAIASGQSAPAARAAPMLARGLTDASVMSRVGRMRAASRKAAFKIATTVDRRIQDSRRVLPLVDRILPIAHRPASKVSLQGALSSGSSRRPQRDPASSFCRAD